MAHCCGFPGRPENDEGVRLVRKMKVDQFSELFKIDAAVFVKRRDERDERTADYRVGHEGYLFQKNVDT